MSGPKNILKNILMNILKTGLTTFMFHSAVRE